MTPKLKLIYNPHSGAVVPDGRINECVDGLLDMAKETPIIYTFGSDAVFDEIRARVAEGHLDPSLITVEFKEHVMTIDKNGRLSKWPNDFCDVTSQVLRRITSSHMK